VMAKDAFHSPRSTHAPTSGRVLLDPMPDGRNHQTPRSWERASPRFQGSPPVREDCGAAPSLEPLARASSGSFCSVNRPSGHDPSCFCPPFDPVGASARKRRDIGQSRERCGCPPALEAPLDHSIGASAHACRHGFGRIDRDSASPHRWSAPPGQRASRRASPIRGWSTHFTWLRCPLQLAPTPSSPLRDPPRMGHPRSSFESVEASAAPRSALRPGAFHRLRGRAGAPLAPPWLTRYPKVARQTAGATPFQPSTRGPVTGLPSTLRLDPARVGHGQNPQPWTLSSPPTRGRSAYAASAT
jgi:hypothetical protein